MSGALLRRSGWMLAVAAAVVTMAACGGSGATVTLSMNAQGGSGESGTALLTDKGANSTQVDLTLTGGGDAGAQASHIHLGTCGSNGAIYQPLNNVQGGRSTTSVPFALSSLTGGRYYINVHRSTDLNVIMACGNIP